MQTCKASFSKMWAGNKKLQHQVYPASLLNVRDLQKVALGGPTSCQHTFPSAHSVNRALIPPGHMVFLGCHSGQNALASTTVWGPGFSFFFSLHDCLRSTAASVHKFCLCHWYSQNNQSHSYLREGQCAHSREPLPVLSWVISNKVLTSLSI